MTTPEQKDETSSDIVNSLRDLLDRLPAAYARTLSAAQQAACKSFQQPLEALRCELAVCKADLEAGSTKSENLKAALRGEQQRQNELHIKVAALLEDKAMLEQRMEKLIKDKEALADKLQQSSGYRRVCASLEASLNIKEAENRNLHASLKRHKVAVESDKQLSNFQALESELADRFNEVAALNVEKREWQKHKEILKNAYKKERSEVKMLQKLLQENPPAAGALLPSSENIKAAKSGEICKEAHSGNPCSPQQGLSRSSEAHLLARLSKADLPATSSQALPSLISEAVDRAMQPGKVWAAGMRSVEQPSTADQLAYTQHHHSPPTVSEPDHILESRRHSDSRGGLHEGPDVADDDSADGPTAQEQCRRHMQDNLSSHSPQPQQQSQVSKWESTSNKLHARQRNAASNAAPSLKSAAQMQGHRQQFQTLPLKAWESAAAEDLRPVSKAAVRPQPKGKQQAVVTRLLDRHVDQSVEKQVGHAKAQASQTAARESDARADVMLHGSEQRQITRPGSNKRKSPEFDSPSPVSGYETDANLEAGRKMPRQDSVPGLPGIMQRPYERSAKGLERKSKEDFLPECVVSPQSASHRATDVRRLPKQATKGAVRKQFDSQPLEKNTCSPVSSQNGSQASQNQAGQRLEATPTSKQQGPVTGVERLSKPARGTRGVLETLHILDMSQGLHKEGGAGLAEAAPKKQKQRRLPNITEQIPRAAEEPQDPVDRTNQAAAPQGYKYREVVRKKAEREELQGFGCADCEGFYKAVQSWGMANCDLPLCGHVKESSLSLADGSTPQKKGGKVAGAVEQMRQQGSRHRYKFEPPPTPEGFWDMGFGDSQDSRF